MNVVSRGSAPPLFDVVLVSLPFGVLNSPSLALGILQARLNAAGIATASRYLTLDYAARVGVDLYNKIAAGLPHTTDLLGEWIFSHALARKSTTRQERYVTRTFGAERPDADATNDGVSSRVAYEQRAELVETVLSLAGRASDFVDDAAYEILKYSPKVVGFTTVFQQNLATIAVASRLRELDPAVKILVGGANCEGAMGQELARAFPFIDRVVSGEADLVIVPLIQSLLANETPASMRRPLQVAGAAVSERFVQTAMVPDLASYYSPSFDDYFRDLGRFWDRPDFTVHIPLETSRGCWWGMVNHCTFCGLNGSTMAFRSRPADDALAEIVDSARRYPDTRISFVDNILDYRYYDSLLPALARLGAGLDLFYEIKSNVTKEQVRTLRDAGVTHIQPGIESLSDQVLKIMKKGVRAIQNVQLLKWCTEFAIKLDWNVLWGFPGEDPDEYERMARLVPLICHLQPPARGSEIRLDRFSPNFTRSSELGFANVRPYEAYFDVYEGLSPEAVFNLSYFFRADTDAAERLEGYTRTLADAIQRWRATHAGNSLCYVELDGRMVVLDSRAMLFGKRVYVLDPLQSQILSLCDKALSLSSLAEALPERSHGEIARAVEDFCDKGMIWGDGQRYVSLVVSLVTYLESRRSAGLEAAIDDLLSRQVSSVSLP